MNDPAAEVARLESLLDTLLRSVSHDLRSPLLSISLSAELIELGGEGVAEATRALRAGVADLERMLQAVTLLSQARRRELNVAPVALGDLLAGRVVISDVPELPSVHVSVDAASIGELLATLGASGPIEAQIAVEDGAVHCDFALRGDYPAADASPLASLAGSLEQFAGTIVETLAVHEVALARQGATLSRSADRLAVTLPIVAR